MKKIMKKHPILAAFLFPVLIILFTSILSDILSQRIGDETLCYAIMRIITALFLLLSFSAGKHPFPQKTGRGEREFSFLLPVGAIMAFNLISAALAGAKTAPLATALLFSFAPGIYEEVIYRRIVLQNLYNGFGEGKKAGWKAILISSASFGVIHLTNLPVLGLETTLIQISYAFVIGLVFGAGYLRTESLPLLLSAHWGIDFTSQIFQTDDMGFTAGEKI
ncbi:MAG: CPBP family intramembrane metalloprotease, partial [Bacillota bacterium]|nr:CPBP family intramembrane metalloprotease [Bacillota bacterium]